MCCGKESTMVWWQSNPISNRKVWGYLCQAKSWLCRSRCQVLGVTTASPALLCCQYYMEPPYTTQKTYVLSQDRSETSAGVGRILLGSWTAQYQPDALLTTGAAIVISSKEIRSWYHCVMLVTNYHVGEWKACLVARSTCLLPQRLRK